MSQNESLQDWFSFKFKNYKLTPKVTPEHRKFFAKRLVNKTDIQNHLEAFNRDVESEEASKRLYYGNPGAGKSHIILHVGDYLESRGFEVVYLECPPLKPRDMPIRLFKEFLEKVSMRRVIDVLDKSYDRIMQETSQDPDITDYHRDPIGKAYPRLKKEFVDGSLITMVSKYITTETEQIQIQRWLMGEKIKDVPVENLTEGTTTLAQVFVTLLKLLSKDVNKKLVLIFDELHQMQEVDAHLAPQFSLLFRELVDDIQTHAAIILCYSASTLTDEDGAGEIINEHVRRRILDSNIIEIKEIKQQELEAFSSDLIKFNRAKDDSFYEEQCEKYQNEVAGEKLVPELYPFTNESIQKLKTAMAQAKPGEIIKALNDSCGEAKSQGRHVIRKEDFETVVRQRIGSIGH